MRNFWSVLLALPLSAVVTACSTPPKHQGDRSVQSEKSSLTNEFYRGEISLVQGRREIPTPVTLQIETFTNENRMELTVHQRVKDELKTVVFDLERIGATEVFFISDRAKTIQGRVRFSGGEDWKWDQWAIGLTNGDQTAIAGAMVREPSTANFRLKLQATSPTGKKLEEAVGELQFVTEDIYLATVDAWRSGRSTPSE